MKLQSILAALLLIPTFLSADDITGHYKVKGFDPIINEKYEGNAIITRVNDVYSILWTYSDTEPYEGTGVRRGDSISFIYHQMNSPAFGTQLYTIDDEDEELKGPWIYFDENLIGKEKLTKKH